MEATDVKSETLVTPDQLGEAKDQTKAQDKSSSQKEPKTDQVEVDSIFSSGWR
jgi:hypothetical protein